MNNADLAVRVLEAAPGPLSIYDIQRGINQEVGWMPGHASLNVSVANDLRCCWAGRGLYGLYRHGYIPGPRRLLDVARFVLLSHGEPLHLNDLSHAMKYLGYRFQDQSLRTALRSALDGEVREVDWLTYTVNQSPAAVAVFYRSVPISPTRSALDPIVERTRSGVRAALAKRASVLRNTRRGLSLRDPIFRDGSYPPEF